MTETADCTPVWNALKGLRTALEDGAGRSELRIELNELEDQFCDFECQWWDHQKDQHGMVDNDDEKKWGLNNK